MIRHRPPREVLEDLRFALDVMEEKSHIGLDDRAADTLRNRILRQIANLEAVIAQEGSAPPMAAEVFELTE